jgi:acyl-coenzyme A synthetase/AMP-(fatty) acid ligase
VRRQLEATAAPRLLVTTPAHLRVLVAQASRLPPVALVLSATAPLSTELAVAAESFFEAPLHEIYGCSEAGQIASRRTVAGPLWDALDGVSLEQDRNGWTWVSGPSVAAETRLTDVIELADDTRFELHGRRADVINVAGKRSSLSHLNHQLTAIEGVEDGFFVMPDEEADAETGVVRRLTAFVVAPGRAADQVLAALRTRIDAAFLPRPLHLVDALPRNALGKLTQADIRELVGRAATRGSGE